MRKQNTYDDKGSATFIQGPYAFGFVYLGYYEKGVAWSRYAFLAPELYSCLCKLQWVLKFGVSKSYCIYN